MSLLNCSRLMRLARAGPLIRPWMCQNNLNYSHKASDHKETSPPPEHGKNKKSKHSELNSTTNSVRSDTLKVFRDNFDQWWDGPQFSILRAMNELRVPFIVDGIQKPISGCKILDVGCGGGILTEALARLGAEVQGIDPVFESVNIAQNHAKLDPNLETRLKYRSCNVEDLSSSEDNFEKYDGVIASEVLEHIENVEAFLINCAKLLKPNGSLFITTINQTPLSYIGVILFGEYILKQLPKGTHSYDMFVNVKALKIMLERLGFHIKLVNGFMYEPIFGKFYWTPSTLTHYAIHAVKVPSKTKMTNLNMEQRRYMAKSIGKKVKKPKLLLDDDEMSQVVDIADFRMKLNNLLNNFKQHVEQNLTTKTSMSTIETLKVQLPGTDDIIELRDIAQITNKAGNLIIINLSSMPDAIKPTLNALSKLSNLNPQQEVNTIYISIPRVTRDHRERLVAAANEAAKDHKKKLNSLLSEFNSKAARLNAQGSGVSKDLVRDTLENLRSEIDAASCRIDETLKSKSRLLLNE